MLDQVVNHFSMQSVVKSAMQSATQSDGWSKTYIWDLLSDLFKDDKIHFIIDGKKILYENIKTQRSTKLTQQHLNFLKYNKIALQVILNRRCAFR